jgi:hypothetical protein
MPTLEYFLVCESVSIDRNTNQLSVFSILEDVWGSLPYHLSRLFAVSAWNIRPEERGKDYQVSLRIHCPGGEVLEDSEDFAVNFVAESCRHRLLQDIRGLEVKQPGELKFEVLLNGQHQATHTVTVHASDDKNPE